MPVFIEWKWQEDTESYLVVFHFDNDYSKPNLRSMKMVFERRGKEGSIVYYRAENAPIPYWYQESIFGDEGRPVVSKSRMVMTWAPSHVELALMTELLCYANIINGYPKILRKELRESGKLDSVISLLAKEGAKIREEFEDKKWLVGYTYYDEVTDKANSVFCFELCPEYIDYLKELLKPYT
jgi:hypothetical protein